MHHFGRVIQLMQDVNHQLFTENVKEEILLSVPDEEREQIVIEALKMVDIEQFAEMHPMALSGDQKQRVAIASAIAADKEFILMNEPTSGLDFVHMKLVAQITKNVSFLSNLLHFYLKQIYFKNK